MKIATTIFCFIALFVVACSPTRKIRNTQPTISKGDTSSPIKATAATTDSARLKQAVVNKIVRNKISFRTFNAKAKVAYKFKDDADDATAHVRIIKDSVLWLSLRGLFRIEGFRILITKDSVKVINYLQNTIQRRGIGYLQQITGLPFNFTTVQDLIIGNPIFIDSNIKSYNVENNRLRVLMEGFFFEHLAVFDNVDNKILESRLDDAAIKGNRTCSIAYRNYDNTAGAPFSMKRGITLRGQNNLDVNLEFTTVSFNEAVSIPFSIPSDYKRI